ncbi:MAG TPA: tetratricopeptide repeat protein, partial [Phycisphaerae bacterium]|nr:tetratricopeptide repeat protein [Phycisphaerae bacterium]
MSYLLEVLGRGLVGRLSDALRDRLDRRVASSREALIVRVEQDPCCVDALMDLALCHLQAGQVSRARDLFLRVIELEPANLVARLAAACSLEQLGLLNEAVDQLIVAADLEPADAAIQYALAYCRERQGRPDDAVVHYGQAIRICPELRSARERLAAIHLVH